MPLRLSLLAGYAIELEGVAWQAWHTTNPLETKGGCAAIACKIAIPASIRDGNCATSLAQRAIPQVADGLAAGEVEFHIPAI